MFKLVVLSALIAVTMAAPKPGYLAAAPLAHVVPAAVSHTSRVDVHSKPLIATYAAAPVAYAHAPLYAHAPALIAPSAYSAYSTSVVGHPSVYAAPHYGYGYAGHGAYSIHPY